MRVFCPEHKRGFFTPRQTPIKCENKGHILGEFDFKGDSDPPIELQWQYCCNCEHFCPTAFGQNTVERCPACARQSSVLYLCDRCYVISFESNTPLQTKNFTLTSEGAPQPSCPGCLQASSADLHEHTCDGLGASFITPLNSCPICRERLDIGPSFPSLVAHYLKRTKVANKLNVTFDYETELFVPVEDGEFVLISNEATQPIVLPRLARFAAKRDFYEIYQDYYHCTKPDAGDVHIIQPATVAQVADGWKPQAAGSLEVLEDKPKKRAPANVTRHEIVTLAHDEAALASVAINEGSPVVPCAHCGSLVETSYAFCWKCGKPMTPENVPSVTRWKKLRAITSSPAISAEEQESTAERDVVPGNSSIFSWALAKETDSPASANAVLRLIAVAVVSLVLVSIGLFVLMRSGSGSRIGSSIATQAVPQNPQGNAGLGAGREIERKPATEPTALKTPPTQPADDDFKKLRARRVAARASDRPAILQAFAASEKQYPNDYRIPYERAKLAIKGTETNAHDEAFAALSLAAEKAIDSGKALEMLDGLQADKTGDFHKLSHGHHEWTQVEEALKSRDKSLLNKE